MTVICRFFMSVFLRKHGVHSGSVRSEGVDLESYRPKELKASFYFDSDAAGTVTLRPELSYGEFSFHPLADENVPKEICRDVPGEFKVSQLITTYLNIRRMVPETL